MTALLLQVCAADRTRRILHHHHHQQHRYLRLGRSHTPLLVASVTKSPARSRLRRATLAPSAPFHHRRRHSSGYRSLSHLLEKCSSDMASMQELRRRSSAADRNPLQSLDSRVISPSTSSISASSSTVFSPTPDGQSHGTTSRDHATRLDKRSVDFKAMPPPSFPLDDVAPKRRSHSRAHSTASISRQANRLSLTLPVAVPRNEPPRHAHSSSIPHVTSVPQTPADTPTAPSPSEPNDFIIAIAAQERKVLELKEELARAEAELTNLKRQFGARETFHKRTVELQQIDSPRLVASPDGSTSATRRSVELDRKKLLLQNQNTPSTPTQGRRRVIRGGHTRTLSLLSPTRPNSEFPVHEDNSIDAMLNRGQPSNRSTPAQTPVLAKRSTWQPRTQQSQPAVPQIVEDFKLGLRAFVEDIRQITVGDEPISGQQSRPASYHQGQTIRPPSDETDGNRKTGRPKVSSISDSPKPSSATPTPADKKAKDIVTQPEKAKAGKQKHFSWTPLGFETLDDNDWSSWESPMSTKSTRWSGSTIHNGGLDDIQVIHENGEDAVTPS